MPSTLLAKMMSEVHKNKPSTVPASKHGAALESQLRAIAFSKARAARKKGKS